MEARGRTCKEFREVERSPGQQGDWITLRAEFKGKAIRIFANGNLLITAEDSRDSEGLCL